MARISFCEFTGDGCDDRNCKIGFCILRNRAECKERIRREEHDAECWEEQYHIAKNALEKRVGKPSHADVVALAQSPKVRALAEKRLSDVAALPPIKL